MLGKSYYRYVCCEKPQSGESAGARFVGENCGEYEGGLAAVVAILITVIVIGCCCCCAVGIVWAVVRAKQNANANVGSQQNTPAHGNYNYSNNYNNTGQVRAPAPGQQHQQQPIFNPQTGYYQAPDGRILKEQSPTFQHYPQGPIQVQLTQSGGARASNEYARAGALSSPDIILYDALAFKLSSFESERVPTSDHHIVVAEFEVTADHLDVVWLEDEPAPDYLEDDTQVRFKPRKADEAAWRAFADEVGRRCALLPAFQTDPQTASEAAWCWRANALAQESQEVMDEEKANQTLEAARDIIFQVGMQKLPLSITKKDDSAAKASGRDAPKAPDAGERKKAARRPDASTDKKEIDWEALKERKGAAKWSTGNPKLMAQDTAAARIAYCLRTTGIETRTKAEASRVLKEKKVKEIPSEKEGTRNRREIGRILRDFYRGKAATVYDEFGAELPSKMEVEETRTKRVSLYLDGHLWEGAKYLGKRESGPVQPVYSVAYRQGHMKELAAILTVDAIFSGPRSSVVLNDCQAGFDIMSHPVLLVTLDENDCPAQLIATTVGFLRGRKVRVPGARCYILWVGEAQGSPFSGSCWNVYTIPATEKIRVMEFIRRVSVYSDDVTVVTDDDFPEADEAPAKLREAGLTSFVFFDDGKHKRIRYDAAKPNPRIIPVKGKSLGVTFDGTFSFRTQGENILVRLEQEFNFIDSEKGWNTMQNTLLVSSFAVPAVSSVAVAVIPYLTQATKKEIESRFASRLKRRLGVPDKASTRLTCTALGLPSPMGLLLTECLMVFLKGVAAGEWPFYEDELDIPYVTPSPSMRGAPAPTQTQASQDPMAVDAVEEEVEDESSLPIWEQMWRRDVLRPAELVAEDPGPKEVDGTADEIPDSEREEMSRNPLWDYCAEPWSHRLNRIALGRGLKRISEMAAKSLDFGRNTIVVATDGGADPEASVGSGGGASWYLSEDSESAVPTPIWASCCGVVSEIPGADPDSFDGEGFALVHHCAEMKRNLPAEALATVKRPVRILRRR
eukprot:g4786.t1